MVKLMDKVKQNLILEHNEDDTLVARCINAAVSYAEDYQHLEQGYYKTHNMLLSTEQAIIMLACHFYESRDGSTGGFFGDNTQASQQVWITVNNLLRLNREWVF